MAVYEPEDVLNGPNKRKEITWKYLGSLENEKAKESATREYLSKTSFSEWLAECNFQWFGDQLSKQLGVIHMDHVKDMKPHIIEDFLNKCSINQSEKNRFEIHFNCLRRYLQNQNNRQMEAQMKAQMESMVLVTETEKRKYDQFKKTKEELIKEKNSKYNQIEMIEQNHSIIYKSLDRVSFEFDSQLKELLKEFDECQNKCVSYWNHKIDQFDCEKEMSNMITKWQQFCQLKLQLVQKLHEINVKYTKEMNEVIDECSFYNMKQGKNDNNNDNNDNKGKMSKENELNELKEEKYKEEKEMNNDMNDMNDGMTGIYGEMNDDNGNNGNNSMIKNEILLNGSFLGNSDFIAVKAKTHELILEMEKYSRDHSSNFFGLNLFGKSGYNENEESEDMNDENYKNHFLLYFRNDKYPSKKTCKDVTTFRSILLKNLRPKITFKLKQMFCMNSAEYRKHGYYFNLGLIGIKKDERFTDQSKLLWDVFSQYDKDITLRKFVSNQELIRRLNRAGLLTDSFEYLFLECCRMTSQASCFVKVVSNQYNSKIDKQLFFSRDPSKNNNGCFNVGDSVTMQLTNDHNTYVMSFIKNENKKNESKKLVDFFLDCQNYHYSYVLSSVCCDCTLLGNFCFEIW